MIVSNGANRLHGTTRRLMSGLMVPLVLMAIGDGNAEPLTDQARSIPSVDFAIYPDSVRLSSASDVHRLLAVATDGDGVTRDVTSELKYEIPDEGLVSIEGGVITPRGSEGQLELRVSWNAQEIGLPVVVEKGQETLPTSFRLDVLPTLTKAGCNMGTCHGSSRGKDGFRLSLFGFDPAGDYHRITRELTARRINMAVPRDSLLLTKAIGAVQHTGGKRFEASSHSYETLLRWLSEGAKDDPAEIARVEQVILYPPEMVIQGIGRSQSLSVIAQYTDGTDRDVTDLAVFFSSDESAASVEGTQVRANGRGESFITARFETHTVGIPVLVLPEGVDFTPNETGGNYVDELVVQKLNKIRVPISPRCSDEEFLRRVTMDVIGLLPTEAEYNHFVTDSSPDKRSRLIDELLQRGEFADLWAAKWADLLMVREVPNFMSKKAVMLYFQWLREQIVNAVPLDEMVRNLVDSTGHSFSNPATSFYILERDRLKTAENVAQIFLGIRTQCAQCHNHPFDRWTMDDYYGFAAFFARVARKNHEDYRQWIVFNGGGETRHPVTKRVVAPRFLGGDVPEIGAGEDRRSHVAKWITSPDNPYFARTASNRIWAHFMGVGIIDPVDDVRVSNPPSNQALLDRLAEKLIEYQYDFRRLAKDILMSNAYQRSSQTVAGNEHDQRNFSHAVVRRIPAVNLLDAISQVTETATKYPAPADGDPGCGNARQRARKLLPEDIWSRNPNVGVCLRDQFDANPVPGTAFAERRFRGWKDPVRRGGGEPYQGGPDARTDCVILVLSLPVATTHNGRVAGAS